LLVHQLLENAALRAPNKIALQCGENALTYREIDNASSNFAASLIRLNLVRQDRIVIFLNNSPESVISLFGALKASMIFIILNPTMKSKKLGYILKDSGAKILISDQQKEAVVQQALKPDYELEYIVWYGEDDRNFKDYSVAINDKKVQMLPWHSMIDTNATSLSSLRCIDVDLSTIIYTSGSTGNPKGVMSTHSNMVFASNSIIQYIENTPDDIIFSVLPLSFDYGLYQLIMSVSFMGTLILEENFAFPFQKLSKLNESCATGFPIVPTMLSLILERCDLSLFNLSSLRYITNTAAYLPSSYIKKFLEHFPHIKIYSMYGLTECKRVSYLPPEDIHRKSGSVGIPIPNTDVFIADKDGVPLPAGIEGELVVRGSHVMQGYWNSAKETEKVFKPGRYRGETLLFTGDLFKQDEDGYLYFIDRMDDLIKTKGERISPKEIEACLYEIEEIVDAAVIGVPDRISGQVLKAFVSVKSPDDTITKRIKLHCQRHLEPFMVPKYYEILDHLPKNNNGKIDKKALANLSVPN
jgi:acyl-CoA synthetase (AMP-forming)/AMP-acid ligase II